MSRRISRTTVALFLGGLFAVSCHSLLKPAPPPPETPVSQYHADSFSWEPIRRVLVLPVLNESIYTRAGDEIGVALSAELQALGRFEVISPPQGAKTQLASSIHRGGRFDEAVMLEIGRSCRADVIVHAAATQYSPYPRPRLGLVLQAVSPRDGVVVSSVDGLWDSTQHSVEIRAKLYYHQLPQRRPWIREHKIAPDNGYADEMALESPQLFQRFVCHEAVERLIGQPASAASTECQAGIAAPPGH